MSTESPERTFARMAYPALGGHDVERAVERGRTQGHAAGYAAGMHAAAAETARLREELRIRFDAETAALRARADHALQLLNNAEQSLAKLTVPVVAEVQDSLAAAALDLAEALLGRELANGETSARAALDRALSGVDTRLVHQVRMHPADLAVLGDDVLNQAGVVFTPDASLKRGDAVTEFPDGFLDATLGTALARAKAALLGDDTP
ncbi:MULTISPECIES: FliH/SctL family protein [unclassified Arthrobacter]|mgnify:CR=1 FL=1|uniref:FliH/SctL family protein n=1 Tax=unclassified Arthrobacter TaxID=235627 RepID=UPI0006DCCB84|nr:MULTISPECIES: FliH/SctL family protein [unclassified Arthrobacter]MSR99996.1 flagellar assembly protein FliH [Arthrobacter sp. BL-252-APC-1A]